LIVTAEPSTVGSTNKKYGSRARLDESALLDLPLPVEIIEEIFSYLSSEDILILGAIGTEWLKECCYGIFKRKPSEIPKLLCYMSRKGDLFKVKQIFALVNQENISNDEMGVRNNEKRKESRIKNQEKTTRLVDNNNGPYGTSPLIEAALKGHTHVCYYLITTQKADIEVRDDNGYTPLIFAAGENHCDVVRLLLDHNANIEAKNEYSYHATYIAAFRGHLNCLKILVEKNEDVVDLKGPEGRTPLIAATMTGMTDVCSYLITKTSINIHLQDKYGKTALHWASKKNIRRILLLEEYHRFRNQKI